MRILVTYSHFYPAFKAGGPVQSLVNLCQFLSDSHEVWVLCKSHDLGERTRLTGVAPNTWLSYSAKIKVFYAEGWLLGKVKRAFLACSPDTVYVNGMFLPIFNWYVLWLARDRPRVVAPRGMLQAGALKIRSRKKKFALGLLRGLGLYNAIFWHATDAQEFEDIKMQMGQHVEVHTIQNLTRRPFTRPRSSSPRSGGLRLVYLSLVARKKNIHLLLEAMITLPETVQLDIYGPIIDEEYWAQCSSLREKAGRRVAYRGIVNPLQVQETLAGYDVFVLPSSGENFGHAIYEALSVGVPVITSQFTPWRLESLACGKICGLEAESVRMAIEFFIKLDQSKFEEMSSRALQVATNYFVSLQPWLYDELFQKARR